jgi:glycosyltransferase involved in cell wall biosynthesis
MKIIHLSTGHLGGAGLAARRLNAGLRAAGVDSEFHALSSASFMPQNGEYQIERSAIQKFSGGLTSFLSQKITNKSLVTPISSSIIDANTLRTMSQGENVIFHVHNWFNLINQFELSALSHEFKITATLHDQRLFTGACHHSFDCKKFTQSCEGCPQLPRVMKNHSERIFFENLDFSKISYITPSNWLNKLASSSKILCDSRGTVIPNSFFGYQATPVIQERTAYPIKVGFAAMDTNSWIKGGDLVKELISQNRSSGDFRFFFLSDFIDYADFWNSIDVLLVPSRAENSPNVIHESKLWGVPVVTTNTGGIPEILTSGFDACINLEALSPESIAAEIRAVHSNSMDFTKRAGVAKLHASFLDACITKHKEFYSLL